MGVVKAIWLELLVVWSLIIIHGILPWNADRHDFYTFPVGVNLNEGDTFDYIVVGAGAAGCAAAARLALAGHSVLLVEAGGDPNLLSTIPSAVMGLLGSSLDWQYPTVPNNVSCLASRGRQCRFSAGRCLGGSTSINYMLYTRGNRRDFDFNITGWNWPDLEPYFLRHEGLQVLNQLPQSSTPYHNTMGVIKLDFFDDPQNPWHSRLFEGFRALKFPYNRDVNGLSQIGISQTVGFVYKGERMSTARAYLGRQDVQRTLKVAKGTLCTGVIIDANNVTRGITALPRLATQPMMLFARKEVILSAGTVRTPQILMLSGIGRAKHLKKMGIRTRLDLPVGDNMSDHVLPLIVILVDTGKTIKADIIRNLLTKALGVAQFILTRGGQLASNGLTDVNAFANTLCYNRTTRQLQNESDDCALPNMQMIHAYIDRNLITVARPLFQRSVGLDDATVDQLAAANVNNALITLCPVVLNPYSRGNIRLASADPSEHPAIYPNYLSDIRDVDEMLRSIRIVEHLVETPAFKRNNATVLHLNFPECPRYEECLSGYWRCYVRHMTHAVYHAVGTCSLDKVVDTKLRVKGVKGLRVADASIFPRIPRGNTEAPTVAVGERVVDFIKEALQEDGKSGN